MTPATLRSVTVEDQGYPWYLNDFFKLSTPLLYDRYYACTGAIADNITQTGGQLDRWVLPAASELATLSIIGNDMGFGNIIKNCIIGKPDKGSAAMRSCHLPKGYSLTAA